jgi:hypothetical protein
MEKTLITPYGQYGPKTGFCSFAVGCGDERRRHGNSTLASILIQGEETTRRNSGSTCAASPRAVSMTAHGSGRGSLDEPANALIAGVEVIHVDQVLPNSFRVAASR